MKLKDFKILLDKLETEHPEATELEIGPYYWSYGGVCMEIEDVTLVHLQDNQKNPYDAVAIHWSC